jgi:hypothetical protein
MERLNFDIKPYAVSESSEKNPYPFGLSYVNQDFWGFKNMALQRLKDKHSKLFNNFSDGELMIVLIELWSFLADTLSFKIDQLAGEVFIDTVTEYKNAVRLAKLVGFKPTPPIPARARFVGTITGVLSDDLRISTPIQIGYEIPGFGRRTMELFTADSSGNPVFGEDIVIPAGMLSTASVIGIEGFTREFNTTSSGENRQIYKLHGDNILYGSISVTVDGVKWELVDYLTNGKQFTVEYAENHTAYLIFGNGEDGDVPNKGAYIKCFYRQGGGTIGNVAAGVVESNVRVDKPGSSHPIIVNFKNYTRGEFGYDGDTIEDIKRKLPLFVRTQDRVVTASDYKYIAELFSSPYGGSVGKAVAALRTHGAAGNVIDLFVLANAGNGTLQLPNDSLLSSLAYEIDKKKMLTDYVRIQPGGILLVDITLDAIVPVSIRNNDQAVREKVFRRIRQFFSLSRWDFGKILKESDLARALSDVVEIEHLDVTLTTIRGLEAGEGHQSVVIPFYNEIIQSDQIVLNLNYRS